MNPVTRIAVGLETPDPTVKAASPPKGPDLPTPTAEVKESIAFGAANKLPAYVAKLVVSGKDDKHYTIVGLNAKELPQLVVPRTQQQVVDVSSPAAAYGYLWNLLEIPQAEPESDGKPRYPFSAVARWIKELHKEHGDELVVVIDEHTATGIPWEMLIITEAHANGLKNVYVGELAKTVRWGHIEPHRDLEFTATPHKGGMVSYLSPLPAETTLDDTEQKLFAEHVAAVTQGATTCLTLKQWRKQVSEGPNGLVYVCCHARVGKDAQLWSLADSDDAVTAIQLAWDKKHLPAIVFLNACGSVAQASQDKYLAQHQLVGFATTFLKRGAAAVIGTISDVYLSHAAAFATQLLARVRANQENQEKKSSLAELIRQLREDAAKELDKVASDPDTNPKTLDAAYQRWFYTFHYVLYGNPALVLELT